MTDVSVKWWNARTPKQKEILNQAVKDTEEFSMKLEDEKEKDLRALIEKNGVKIYDPTPAEVAEWRKAGATIWSKMPGVDQALLKRLDAAAQAVK